MRNYAQSKPADYELLTTRTQKGRSAWAQPLIKENWPSELADGLASLYANRELLWELLESAPQSPCHLDFWPNNVIVTERDEVVLIDWAFFGSGSLVEDVGNFIPDAIFDGFFAGEDIGVLESTMWRAYTAGLADFDVGLDLPLRRYLHASAVKYVWLAPLLLARAKDAHQLSYGGEAIADRVDVNEQYRARGMALMRLCEWADEAVKEKHEIG